jgi:hypothetical protein
MGPGEKGAPHHQLKKKKRKKGRQREEEGFLTSPLQTPPYLPPLMFCLKALVPTNPLVFNFTSKK